jgi:DNA (cytosine-5)-methyltransferase 1
MKSIRKKLTVIDIFCGAGGFSQGFHQAGYKILAGVDIDQQAISTYAHNFPTSTAISWDLSKPLSECSEANIVLNDKVDIIVGGPPCQGFSIAGKRNHTDPRNRLFKAYFDIIRQTNPRAVVIENVPTMLTMNNGEFINELEHNLFQSGYKVYKQLLWANQYGVPQKRKRLIIVALDSREKTKDFSYPEPIKGEITCHEALSDLPLLDNEVGAEAQSYNSPPSNQYQKKMRGDTKVLYNHWAVIHTEQTKKIIALVPDGGNYKSLPESLWQSRKVNIAWTRMKSSAPCFTIDAGHNHHFHYKANRVPTVRESARIQSFPDHFRFLGNKTSQFRQVGNAIPPLMAEAVAKAIYSTLTDEKA